VRQKAYGDSERPDEREDNQPARAVMSALEESVSLFFRLRAVLEDIHGHSDISGSMRSVMRDLNHHGPQTVPQMARRRPVSRQHIQAIVNDLQRAGLVSLSENPRHKRSRLVRMTPAGEEALQAIILREHEVLNRIELPVSIEELAQATTTMARLRETLESKEWRQTVRRLLYQDGNTPQNPWIDEGDDYPENAGPPIHQN
jgi:DNA-binding MarR family transcriptional regulator